VTPRVLEPPGTLEAPLSTVTAWFLGLLLGMRHALEPDHLTAVSTLVTEEDPGQGAHVHIGRRAFAVRPLVVGVIHGLAGTGALTALVLAGFDSHLERIAYTVVFGSGSVLGMAMLSGLAGWPMARLLRTPRARGWASAAAGMLSVTMGLLWGWPLLPKLLG